MQQAFDGCLRGMAAGETRQVELAPLQSSWTEDLVFQVPQEHEEVQRLQGRYRSRGGLLAGMVVELVSGQQAQVVDVTDSIITLDANDAMAGHSVTFELELISIEKDGIRHHE